MSWEYIQPVRIIFGRGKRKETFQIAKESGFQRGMLVCSPFFERSGFAAAFCEKSAGMLIDVFSDITPNPTTSAVDACAERIRACGADFIVALGGGSPMDLAKAAAVIAPRGDSITKYHNTGLPVPDQALPLIALPTTSGSGSEVSAASVLSDEKGVKNSIFGKSLFPVAAIVDPELTYTVPAKITAQSGLDALSHAIEGVTSIYNQPICDALAVQAVRLIFKHLREAVAGDHLARDYMAQASVLAMLAFALPKSGPPHAFSYGPTGRYGIPHGEACALTLDYFLELAAVKEGARLNDFAVQAGFSDVSALASGIRTLKQDLGMLTDLKGFRLTDADVKELVHDAKRAGMKNSPLPITEEMLYALYERLR